MAMAMPTASTRAWHERTPATSCGSSHGNLRQMFLQRCAFCSAAFVYFLLTELSIRLVTPLRFLAFYVPADRKVHVALISCLHHLMYKCSYVSRVVQFLLWTRGALHVDRNIGQQYSWSVIYIDCLDCGSLQ